jgi:hypothetical protein
LRTPPPFIALVAAIAVCTTYFIRVDQQISEMEYGLYLGLLILISAYGLWWILLKPVSTEKSKSRMPRGVKVSMASLGLAMSLMLVVALIMLPIVGFNALKVLVGSWSPILWIIGGLMLIPFVEKRLY